MQVMDANASHCFVVDDEEDICQLISRTLARYGVTSSGFTTAQAAIDSLNFASPSVIFLDITLEGSDGVDALRWLGEVSYPGVVQLVSGQSSEVLDNVKKIGERHGLRMRPPIRKPFRSAAIQAVIEEERLATVQPSPPPLSPASMEMPVETNAPAKAVEQPPARVSLREALRHGWVEFWYQPKLDLQKLTPVGAEGLARVRHPTLGIIEPAAFLADAAEVDLAVLGGLGIETALRDWSVFARHGLNLKIAVNMSAAGLELVPVAALIRQHRPQTESWPGLILEVTENDAVHDMARMHELAIQMGLYQVSLSIDDFGAGYCSLARLRDLPFAEVKLDRSFVQNCATDERNRNICQATIELGHRLGAKVVAEGIEQKAELQALVRMGCDLGQGFLFSRPVERDRLLTMLAPPPQRTDRLAAGA
jgi:EAL domain-containing protein (putative c-di-GMP-specific phosphodiesterase class I)/CheY-like chemotaxis protein